MNVKTFELRDRGTFVPVLCVQLGAAPDSQDEYLIRRAGYAFPLTQYVLMTGLDGGTDKMTCDPYDWGGNRTRIACHKYIIEHWEKLQSGQVVDAEFVLGETETSKLSERIA